MTTKFLINTNTFWEEAPRARHQVTYELSKKYKVIFISASHFGLPKLIDSNVCESIQLLIPYFPINNRIRYRIPLLNELFQIWLFKRLKESYKDLTVINFDFSAYLIHCFFKKVIYYRNDNFTSISEKINIWPIYKYHKFCEKKTIAKSRICIGISAMLTTELLKINEKSYTIPLGGPDIDEFDIKLLPAKKSSNSLNIGLVGFIGNYNLSFQLINDILNQIDCIITFIGPVEDKFLTRITQRDRIVTKGVLMGKELLDQINQIDIAIAPYLERKITEGGVPNKLLIYLALGKPVVATELLSLKQMNLSSKLIYLVKDPKDFPSKIKQANEENCWDYIQERVRYAKDNTWEIRMNHFIEILNLHF